MERLTKDFEKIDALAELNLQPAYSPLNSKKRTIIIVIINSIQQQQSITSVAIASKC